MKYIRCLSSLRFVCCEYWHSKLLKCSGVFRVIFKIKGSTSYDVIVFYDNCNFCIKHEVGTTFNNMITEQFSEYISINSRVKMFNNLLHKFDFYCLDVFS